MVNINEIDKNREIWLQSARLQFHIVLVFVQSRALNQQDLDDEQEKNRAKHKSLQFAIPECITKFCFNIHKII